MGGWETSRNLGEECEWHTKDRWTLETDLNPSALKMLAYMYSIPGRPMDLHCPLSTIYLYSVLLLWHPMSWPDWAAGSADSTYLVGFHQVWM